MKAEPCSIKRVKRQVIGDQLLTALDDKSNVAILVSKGDLNLLIKAMQVLSVDTLQTAVERTRTIDFYSGLVQLRNGAFPR